MSSSSFPAAPRSHLRAALQQLLASGKVPAGPRADYMAALIDPSATPAAFKNAQSDYFADVGVRYAKDTALLQTESGRTRLKKRVAARKAAARAMFPGAKNPLPILEPDKPAPAPDKAPRSPASKSPASCEHQECSAGEAWDDTCVAFAQLACGCE